MECWLCASQDMRLFKPANISGPLTSQDFAISDGRYGVTGELWRCGQCGFVQIRDMGDVLRYYESLQDPSYESGRRERAVQADKILFIARRLQPQGRLLDIGCGSGILVERALEMGYQAEGVEPCAWLHDRACDLGFPVRLGTFPHPDLMGPYDVITLIDVIEHVPQPLDLLRNIKSALAEEGIVVVATPDISSLAARLLGKRWWGYRIAHVGYFTPATLALAMSQVRLYQVGAARIGRYFPSDYLAERLAAFLPGRFRPALPSALQRLVIPVNLRDFYMGVFAPDASHLCRRIAR
jgi:SAM-dependent methyltransferase